MKAKKVDMILLLGIFYFSIFVVDFYKYKMLTKDKIIPTNCIPLFNDIQVLLTCSFSPFYFAYCEKAVSFQLIRNDSLSAVQKEKGDNKEKKQIIDYMNLFSPNFNMNNFDNFKSNVFKLSDTINEYKNVDYSLKKIRLIRKKRKLAKSLKINPNILFYSHNDVFFFFSSTLFYPLVKMKRKIFNENK